ncbi:response regulator transcription factor [Arsenicicoccus piscis]|nr:response regulator transcription factor [Arsenicicoccus piscis]MCH8626587.1 response regulator transcription factor [Arsenicicoccus piscis]
MGTQVEEGATLRVLLVDDQQLVRSGFSMMLSVEDDIEVVGQGANGAEALELTARLRPDVILMDVQMPVMDGIEATRRIVEDDLSKVIILTTFDRDDYLFDGLRAGASGFLLKNADPEHLVEAVRAVGHGHALLAPEVTRRVIEQMAGGGAGLAGAPAPAGMTAEAPAGADPSATRPPTDPVREKALDLLTEREREVLGLMGRGLSNAEIAKELYLGEATVKTHVSNCLAKLHLRDRVQAVVFAYEAGLILPGE